MSITTVTAYPSKYVNEEWLDDKKRVSEEWLDDGEKTNGITIVNRTSLMEPSSIGEFHLRFNLQKMDRRYYTGASLLLREVADVIGAAIGVKPVFERCEKCYRAGSWLIEASLYNNSITVTSDSFDIDRAEEILRVLNVLNDARYVPDGAIDICFMPDVYDIKLIMNLCNIMEARNELIVQALGLKEDIRIIIDEELAFGVMLDAFSFDKIEACVYLLRQASLMAANTGKARMKPCDGSNPKYQMRTWLLRLGFIGEQFARPRQTLLNGLDGDGAFFSEDSKDRAAMKRKAKGKGKGNDNAKGDDKGNGNSNDRGNAKGSDKQNVKGRTDQNIRNNDKDSDKGNGNGNDRGNTKGSDKRIAG